jgi:hypothetical protein
MVLQIRRIARASNNETAAFQQPSAHVFRAFERAIPFETIFRAVELLVASRRSTTVPWLQRTNGR